MHQALLDFLRIGYTRADMVVVRLRLVRDGFGYDMGQFRLSVQTRPAGANRFSVVPSPPFTEPIIAALDT